jgi:signal transduction histidine kinase/HAMP domain-containing protein/ActR/RegA family two-component response regulator
MMPCTEDAMIANTTGIVAMEAQNTQAVRTADLRPLAGALRSLCEGDFSVRAAEDSDGVLGEMAGMINCLATRNAHLAAEMQRVRATVTGTGTLDERLTASPGRGSWAETVSDANELVEALAMPMTNATRVLEAVAEGDLSQHMELRSGTRLLRGDLRDLAVAENHVVDRLSSFTGEVMRVAHEVGTEGRLGGRASTRGLSGSWRGVTEAVNTMASRLTRQVRDIAAVTTAVASGDLTRKVTVETAGELLELKLTVNTMVDQLSAFADEVTRVAREVGTEGMLGGQAQVRDVSGVWKDLTDNVNFMASNLTSQVRNIAQVATAVANGDLSKKIDVDARGEILELKTTLNTMVDTLSAFSSEVTRVAREVGSEGQLGGQARVEGVSGNWKRLTTGVNELALNLTTQVRAIGEVASAVAKGDMSRSITVEAQGEVADLKDNVNRMVSNLRETTRTKDWLESNLTRIAGLMQGHRDLVEVADLILRELAPLVNAHSEVFFLVDSTAQPGKGLELLADYGIGGRGRRDVESESPLRGLIAQAVRQKKRILIEDAPPDYVTVESGLGSSPASSILILPILFEDRLLGVIELASFSTFNEVQLTFVDQFAHTIGVSFNTILANARTEALLSESQRLTSELRKRSDELQRSNAELEEKAALLATSSQYKSEFLANMSHELRTPLNSLLILARLLADNPDGRLSGQEVDFASTIYSSGSDLLQLISDILDLSKVEAGRMDVRPRNMPLTKLLDYVHATFRPLTIDRGLTFEVVVAEDVPRELYSDEQRIQQVLRNLLSNAVKFTNTGGIELRVERIPASDVDDFEEEALREAESVIAFSVKDTGIGIPAEKLSVVFEAFQQSEGNTNRKYGGTGLGLSISREIAGLLGGRIDAESEEGVGSCFTLFIPAQLPSLALAASSGSSTPQLGEPDRIVERGAGMGGSGGDRTAGPGMAAVRREVEAAPRSSPDHVLGSAGTPSMLPEAPSPSPPRDRTAPAPVPDAAVAATLDTPETPAAPAPGERRMPPLPGDRDREDTWPETTRLKQWLSGRAGRVLAGRHILIVDDDIRNVFALTHMLGRVGISVKYAENGREGFEVLDRSPEISLVLMDIMMPEVDGYEAIRMIRSTPRLAGLPIIALTAKAMPGDREKAIEAGANNHVPKPVNVDQLLSAIFDELASREGGQAPPGEAPPPEPQPPGRGDRAGVPPGRAT